MSQKDLVPRQPAWSSPSFLGDNEVRAWRWFAFHKDPNSSFLSSSFIFFCLKRSRRRCLSLPLPAQLPISSPLGLEADRERRLLPLPNAVSPSKLSFSNHRLLAWEMSVQMRKCKHVAQSSAPGENSASSAMLTRPSFTQLVPLLSEWL